MDIFDRVPFLKENKPRPYFPPRPGSTPREKPRIFRKQETWMYTVEMQLYPNKQGGLIVVYHYNRKTPIAKADFIDRLEGDTLFDQAWEAAQELTREEEAKLR